MNYPTVSIVIVNFNGEGHLLTCLNSLVQLDYPTDRLEIIVVDNASQDDSVQLIKDKYPAVKIIENERNMGFAQGVNQGARASTAEYLALLNNDMKVHADWLEELIKVACSDRQIVCLGSKVLDWNGEKVDFIGSMMNFEGRGFQIDFGKQAKSEKDLEPRPMLFVNGGAMLVNREIFNRLGGFDEDFFAYYEDVDFGWRVWVCGYEVYYVPKSVVNHQHHGTSGKIGNEKLRLLYERNALYSIFKNYSWENLQRAFPAALLLLIKRVTLSLDINKEDYKIAVGTDENGHSEEISKESVSHLLAIDDFIENLPKLWKKREDVQAKRGRSDALIFRLFKGEFLSILSEREYQEAQMEVQKYFGIYEMFQQASRVKVLIISHEVVSEKMAGPAIRAWEFARVLSKDNDVTLAVPNKNSLKSSSFAVETYNSPSKLKKLAAKADVIICQGMILALNSYLARMNKPIVVDIYDPFILSLLEQHKESELKEREIEYKSSLDALLYQLSNGDFFICASEKQRDFWIGLLAATGRINPQTYDSDETFRSLIGIVPFGIPSNKPKSTREVVKGVFPGIKKTDKVVLWGGGIYNWLDPLTPIRAIKKISESRLDIKLVFMGLKHPNPCVPEMEMANKAVALAEELDLIDKYVFFNFGWVAYEDRQNYLLEADIGLSTHFEHIETRFSYRTRVLDCIWASLPIICTEGDAISQLVSNEKLGITVPADDSKKLEKAILDLIDQPNLYDKCCKNIEKAAVDHEWKNVLEPLIDFCRNPYFTTDKISQNNPSFSESSIGKSYYLSRAKQIYSNYGLIETIKRSSGFVKRRLKK